MAFALVKWAPSKRVTYYQTIVMGGKDPLEWNGLTIVSQWGMIGLLYAPVVFGLLTNTHRDGHLLVIYYTAYESHDSANKCTFEGPDSADQNDRKLGVFGRNFVKATLK